MTNPRSLLRLHVANLQKQVGRPRSNGSAILTNVTNVQPIFLYRPFYGLLYLYIIIYDGLYLIGWSKAIRATIYPEQPRVLKVAHRLSGWSIPYFSRRFCDE